MREKGQTEVAKTLETPVFSRGIEILTEKYDFSNNIDIDKYNNFSLDFYGAVMTMFAPIMKLTSKEIENLEQYLK